MPSPITGVWELVSDTEKALRIITETHMGTVFERTTTRRGILATYTVESNRLHQSILVDTATNSGSHSEAEFDLTGDRMTSKLVVGGTVSPIGHVDTWRKVSDLHMTSPFSGVWQLISETDKALSVRTDTHWVTIMNRGEDYRRGMVGTYTVEGNCFRNVILVDTALNVPSQIDVEQHLEGETLLAKRLAGTVSVPAGHVDQWRKIG